MENKQRFIRKLILNKKNLITTSAIIFLTLSNVSAVQADDGETTNNEDYVTEIKENDNQQVNNKEILVEEAPNDEVNENQESNDETDIVEGAESSQKNSGEESDNTQDKFNTIVNELTPLLNENQNEALTSIILAEDLNESFKEGVVNHESNEFENASDIYESILTSFELTEGQEKLLNQFNQLTKEYIQLTEYTYTESQQEDSTKEDKDDADEANKDNLSQNTDSEVDNDSTTQQEEQVTDEKTLNEETDSEQDSSEQDPSNQNPSEQDPSEQESNVQVTNELSADEQDVDKENLTNQNMSIQTTALTAQPLSSQRSVNYRGYLADSSDLIYTTPGGSEEDVLRNVGDLRGQEVKVLEEADTQQTTWAYIEVVGTNVSGWIDKTGIDAESVLSQTDVNYRGYLERPNDTINTQPWGTPGYEEIRRVQDLQGSEVKVLEEAETQRATWVYVDIMGTSISGWIDKAGVEAEAVSSQQAVNYRGYLARPNDTINTQPWGTPGYEEIRRVQDLQDTEVKVLEEAETQRATWLYVDVTGTNISGWIDKAGVEAEAVSSQQAGNYRGYLARPNDTINTQPWGTPGYEEIRRVQDLQGTEVKVLEEAETQRATWLYVDVTGTNISGWIDKAGVEAEAVSSQQAVNYRGYLARPNDTINTQPWGTPGYEEIRRVQDLQGTEVKVLEEVETQRATWLYVDVTGTNISGWVDKAGVAEEAISTQKEVDYRGFLLRPTDTINTQPWGTPGYQEIRNVNDLVDQEVHVTQEATTQRADWAYINVVGTDISGWIDKAGIEQASIAYRTTYYDRTFEEALNIQMKNGYPQTDLYGGGWQDARREDVAYYLNPENFVDVQNGSTPVNIESLQIATGALNVRTGPSTSYPSITTIESNEVYDILDQANGWYKIDLNGAEGWVSGGYISLISEVQYSNFSNNEVATVTAAALNVRQGPSTNYSIETQVHNNETYEVLDQSNGWYQLDINGTEGWVSGNYITISNDIDSEALQFLSLSSPSGITVSDLNNELEGKGILENQGAAFIEASQLYNINEIYLVSHALLETGHGTSELATGVDVNGTTVYNMFGIGAYDGMALEAGSQRAYEEGWDTPRKAIIGGAEFIANSYINSPVYKQDTLYKMKWNPANPSVHQYATDIGWAIKQTNMLDQIIELSNEYNLALKFDIPIYR